MRVEEPAAESDQLALDSERGFRKAAVRLIPLLALGYFFNYIDRTNVGFAALEMNADLGLSASEFGMAAGIFYFGYCLLEVPSNLAMVRFGARRWLARIMISWGALSAATAFVTGPVSFNIVRLLAGAAEAGFYPGVIFYLTSWFPASHRARVFAWFILAIPLSSVIGGPVSVGILTFDGFAGLRGWQWLFILEGLPACALGLVCLYQLVDTPEDARWLSEQEKRAMRLTLQNDKQATTSLLGSWATIRDARVLLLSASYFCFLVGILGIGIWMPQILKDGGLNNTQVGFASAAPYFIASLVMVIWSRKMDKGKKYLRDYATGCVIGGVGFAISVWSGSLFVAMLGLTIALSAMNGARPAFFSIPAQFLSGKGAATGIAFINSVGNLGGFVGPSVMGFLRDYTGSFKAGLACLSAMLVLSALLAMSTRWCKDR